MKLAREQIAKRIAYFYILPLGLVSFVLLLCFDSKKIFNGRAKMSAIQPTEEMD